MKPLLRLSLALLAALAAASAAAGPLRPDHPFIGSWRIDLPTLACHEIYDVHANGTTLVTSNEEVAESEFQIADQPSPKGFYKWVDTITRDNGRKDCAGEVSSAGHESVNYIFLHPSGDQFLMCEKEDVKTCIGPFVRMLGGQI